jgi:hypothetical protein
MTPGTLQTLGPDAALSPTAFIRRPAMRTFRFAPDLPAELVLNKNMVHLLFATCTHYRAMVPDDVLRWLEGTYDIRYAYSETTFRNARVPEYDRKDTPLSKMDLLLEQVATDDNLATLEWHETLCHPGPDRNRTGTRPDRFRTDPGTTSGRLPDAHAFRRPEIVHLSGPFPDCGQVHALGQRASAVTSPVRKSSTPTTQKRQVS